MKALIFIGTVLRAAQLVSANALAAMEASADTWCVTYLSTYIAAVTNQGDLSPTDRPGIELPSAQNSGRLPFAPSLRPTFARNTSTSITRSAMSADIGPDSALFTSDVINTADTSPINSKSSDLDVDPTAVQESSSISTISDGLSAAVTLTTDAEATPTSTDIIEPAGRNVIFLIQSGVNEKRSFYKRANNEFVGEDNPDVCTFAATFNLAEDEGQLFASGLPIFYAGEDFKELSPQGSPPSGSVTSGFTDAGGSLAFQNGELPNGEAGFCQDVDGQVYITFTTGPSGCTPVSLGIYNVEQCQNGRLVGLDELMSSVPGTGTATVEESFSTQSTFGELPESTGLVPSESIISASQTSELEASLTPSSYVTDSSTQESDDTTSQETSASTVREDVETLSTVSITSGDPASEPPIASTSETATETSDLLESTVTSNDGSGPSTTSGVESQATTEIQTSDTETATMTSVSETTVISETTETTGVDTSSTEIGSDIDTTTADAMDTTTTTGTTAITDTTATTEGGTSGTEAVSEIDTTATTGITATTDTTTTTEGDASSTEVTSDIHTTTTLPENPTTTEAETTTAEITTTAEPTTTTTAAPEPQLPCRGLGNPYTYRGVTFDLRCGRIWSYTKIDSFETESFNECLRRCALIRGCNAVAWDWPVCGIGSEVTDRGANPNYDHAQVISRAE
ncbi:hypothetical protein NW752_001183 [Fusarium irregulare]|nr:hypothetical protein NW752_001183 [Fusarium irregulare]